MECRSDHYYGFALSRSRFAPVCAAPEVSRQFLMAASPPLRGGEYIWTRLRSRAMIFAVVGLFDMRTEVSNATAI